jgi:hypothetical protein
MTAVAPARHEPAEREDPRNRMLDVFDTLVESLKDNGLEPQLRARVARLLPAEPAASLPLSQVLIALRDVDRCRLSDDAKKRNRAARAIVTQMMGAA